MSREHAKLNALPVINHVARLRAALTSLMGVWKDVRIEVSPVKRQVTEPPKEAKEQVERSEVGELIVELQGALCFLYRPGFFLLFQVPNYGPKYQYGDIHHCSQS